MKPSVIHRRLDYCDVCGLKHHAKDLCRTQVSFVVPAGSNYFTYSKYNASGWSYTKCTDAGEISVGASGRKARVSVAWDSGNTQTEVGGSQTWTGGGYILSLAGVDLDGWTSFVVSADFGGYHRNTGAVDFTIYICDSTNSAHHSLVTKTVAAGSSSRLFYYYLLDVRGIWPFTGVDKNDVYFAFNADPVVTGEKWWVENMRLEKDVSTPGNALITTRGATVDRDASSESIAVRQVCPSCLEKMWQRSKQIGVPRTEIEPPITTEMQEL